MSPTRKKILSTAVAIAGLAIALAILFVPSVSCACLTPADVIGRVFDADLVGSSESELHAAILRRLPVGTPAAEIEKAVYMSDDSGNPGLRMCTRTDAAIRCHIDLGSSVAGGHRRDMDLELLLDQADRLAGVRVRKHRWILGLQM